MALRLLKVITTRDVTEKLENVIQEQGQTKTWKLKDPESATTHFSVLLPSEKSQKVIELIQTHLGTDENTEIIVLSPTAAIPSIETEPAEEEKITEKTVPPGISTEEIYDDVTDGAKLTANYIVLVLLSTVVATIGLIENNIPVLIGAMLIAPLLDPNLALALASTLGDFKLMLQAIKVNVIGLLLTVIAAFTAGKLLHLVFNSGFILLRANVGYDSVILALASGAAGVLSLISGLSGSLVGVMVAVALLPPTVTTGIALSMGKYDLALGAILLLAINIVCINLSANILFWIKGIRPTLWREKKLARKTVFWIIAFWTGALILLIGIIFYKSHYLA